MNSSAPRLLRRYLWTWALLTLAIVWLALAAVAYYTGLDEADEILDGHLVSVAEPLLLPAARLLKATPQPATPPARSPYATVYAPELRLVVWDDERVVWDTHGIAALLPASLAPGHHTLVLDPAHPASTWRVFVADASANTTTARRAAVTDIDAVEPGESVEQAVAVAILDMNAASAGDDAVRTFAARMLGEMGGRMEEILPVPLIEHVVLQHRKTPI